MTRSTRYPGADRTRFYGGGNYSGIDQPRLEKIVLHSTETSPKWGCPGYSGGGAAPTFTIDPWSGKVWQHFDTNESARALLNPTSTPVSENRDGVCQIEIIGYSDAKIAKTYGYDLRDLTDAGYAHIAKLVKWIATEWSVPLTFPKEWPAYPASYGNSPARMTSSEYDRFSGVLAHLHVSGNSHGDVTIDVGRLKAALGTTTSIGGSGSPEHVYTRNEVRYFQRVHRLDDDGLWGPATEKQAQAIRRCLKPGLKTSKWDLVRYWHLRVAKGGQPSQQMRRAIQGALKVKIDGQWGPTTDAAWLAMRSQHRVTS